MAHIIQIQAISAHVVLGLCCDGRVRMLRAAQGLFDDGVEDPCGPGCEWEKAKRADATVARQEAMLAAVQAAEKKATDLLNAYRKALRTHSRDVYSDDELDALVLRGKLDLMALMARRIA